MKIKKYPQFCLMIKSNNKKILVDAGCFKYEDRFVEGRIRIKQKIFNLYGSAVEQQNFGL